MTSSKEIQRILEIKENGDEILQHLVHSLEIYGKWEWHTNTSPSTSEKTGRIQRRTLQTTSNKEIQTDSKIKEEGDEIKQHLTHSLEIYDRWESQTNASTSTSEKTGRIKRWTLQMTSNKEIFSFRSIFRTRELQSSNPHLIVKWTAWIVLFGQTSSMLILVTLLLVLLSRTYCHVHGKESWNTLHGYKF
jgi:hypothetical protein